MRFSGTFKGHHRSGAARAEVSLRQVATPRNWLRGRCVEQPVQSNKEIPLSVPEDRTVCPLGVREAYIAKKLFHARLMIQGTGSDVGKSLIVVALCRIAHRPGGLRPALPLTQRHLSIGLPKDTDAESRLLDAISR